MPAWQGSVGDTVAFLVDEGYPRDQAVAIAYRLAEEHGATRAALLSIKTQAHAKMLDDASLIATHARAHRAWKQSGSLPEAGITAHGHLCAELKARGLAECSEQLGAEAPEPTGADKAASDHVDGVMVAWRVPAELAARLEIEGGEKAETLHCTLCYLGKVHTLLPGVLTQVDSMLREYAAKAPALTGRLGGIGRFAASDSSDGQDVAYVSLDVPGLEELRHDVVALCAAAGAAPAKEHGFIPHVTLGYIGADEPSPIFPLEARGTPVTVSAIVLAVGDEGKDIPLTGDPAAPTAPSPTSEERTASAWALKQSDEKRYTLSIAYPANQLDVHGEFADAAALERAAWRYLAESRRVGIQHRGRGNNGAGHGEIVESYIYRGPDWTVGGEKVVEGDWLVGVVWTPEAWAKIKRGELGGLSFQGLVQKEKAPAPERKAPPMQPQLPL